MFLHMLLSYSLQHLVNSVKSFHIRFLPASFFDTFYSLLFHFVYSLRSSTHSIRFVSNSLLFHLFASYSLRECETNRKRIGIGTRDIFCPRSLFASRIKKPKKSYRKTSALSLSDILLLLNELLFASFQIRFLFASRMWNE